MPPIPASHQHSRRATQTQHRDSTSSNKQAEAFICAGPSYLEGGGQIDTLRGEQRNRKDRPSSTHWPTRPVFGAIFAEDPGPASNQRDACSTVELQGARQRSDCGTGTLPLDTHTDTIKLLRRSIIHSRMAPVATISHRLSSCC